METSVRFRNSGWARRKPTGAISVPIGSANGLKTEKKAIISDLVALREKLIAADDSDDPDGAAMTIGIPLAMYAWDQLPFWRRFFRDCGFKVVVSGETNRQTVLRGLDSVVAEPCFPIIVAHGHVAELKDKGGGLYLVTQPIVSSETRFKETESYVCPWGQTLPFIIRQVPQLRDPGADKILCPTIRRREGKKHQRDVMTDVVQKPWCFLRQRPMRHLIRAVIGSKDVRGFLRTGRAGSSCYLEACGGERHCCSRQALQYSRCWREPFRCQKTAGFLRC